MQVLCKASNTASDVRCEVCGQGFLVYWTRTSAEERTRRKVEIAATLRAHHEANEGAHVHPTVGFNLPEWGGEAAASAAALLGNAPQWATV